MAKFSYNDIGILGISTVVGENKIDFVKENAYYNNDIELLGRLQKTIGFGQRYWANSQTTTSDLCLKASEILLKELNFEVSEIDAIISVTQTPDYYMPGNAHVLHEKLGLSKSSFAVDIELGCSGFIFGLQYAYSLLNSGLKKVLLVCGDTLSKVVNHKDRTEAPLFCDAGSACIIEYKENKYGKSYFILNSDGSGVKKMLQPAGAYRNPSSPETKIEVADKEGNIRSQENIYMSGVDIFNFTLIEQPKTLQEILDLSNNSKDEIDYYIFHQGNNFIVDTLAKSLKLEKEKVPKIFSKYGNQNAASIPGTICDMLQDTVFDNSKIVMQGFGIGLSWGACMVRFVSPTILKTQVMD